MGRMVGVGVGLLLRIEFSFLQKSFIETMVLLVCVLLEREVGWQAQDVAPATS